MPSTVSRLPCLAYTAMARLSVCGRAFTDFQPRVHPRLKNDAGGHKGPNLVQFTLAQRCPWEPWLPGHRPIIINLEAILQALAVPSLNRAPVGQSLALRSFQGRDRAPRIVDLAMVVAEVELAQIAMQMGAGDMVVDPIDSPL